MKRIPTPVITPYKKGKEYFIKMYGTEYQLILEDTTSGKTKEKSTKKGGQTKKASREKISME